MVPLDQHIQVDRVDQLDPLRLLLLRGLGDQSDQVAQQHRDIQEALAKSGILRRTRRGKSLYIRRRIRLDSRVLPARVKMFVYLTIMIKSSVISLIKFNDDGH